MGGKTMTKRAPFVGVVLCFLLFAFSVEAAVFEVIDSFELQEALTIAQANGEDDTINLAPGLYTVSSTLTYFAVESENYALTIQGQKPEITILDGGNSTAILEIDQSALTEGAGAHVTLKGIAFRNGNQSSLLGGAVFIANYYAQTTIEDCEFQTNTAAIGGGAVYLIAGDTTLSRNTFKENYTGDLSSTGGALYAMCAGGTVTLEKNIFTDNFCLGSGGGIYVTNSGPIFLTGNTFSNNVAGEEGGGGYVSVEFGGTLTASKNKFTGNTAASSGGIFVSSQTDPIILSENIFRNNVAATSAESHGGGLTAFSQYSLRMVNNLFAQNTTSQRGAGAMLHLYSRENQIINNTFTENVSTGAFDEGTSQGAGIFVITDRNETVLNIYNNIFWANSAIAPIHRGTDFYINDDGFNDNIGATVNVFNNDYSEMEILRGDHLSQGLNINSDPLFDVNYRLTPGSPCVDSGNNSAPGLPLIDLAGDPRIHNGVVDMGAYEWAPRGMVQVTINPRGAVSAGAKWRVNGGLWHSSGDTEDLLVGEYPLEFSDVSGWIKPVDQVVTILEGVTTNVTGTYVAVGPTGSLQVVITPQSAIDGGAKWRVDGGPWHESGEVQTDVPVGIHTVWFSDVPGLITPQYQPVTIYADQLTTATGVYEGRIGSLRVTIAPPEAVTAGAHWRVDGGVWRPSGYTQTVSVGSHSVEFSDVTGWKKPLSQAVTINEGVTTSITGTYTRPLGNLLVTISPQGAIDAGAKWRRVGTTTWRDSGTTETGILAGTYTVEFKDVAGWTKPGNRTVTITEGHTTTVSGTYTPQPPGSLMVTITPQGAIDAGAKWRVDGGTWHDSGYTQTGLLPGQHILSFSDVPGWAKPGDRLVTISSGRLTTATGNYTNDTGSLQVTIVPQGAIDSGAKWRVDSGSWLNSGEIVTGVSVGLHVVEFSDIANWTKPDNQSVTIVKDQTTTASGTYIQHTGSLQVTISPQGAIDAGARWRRVGTTTWLASGATETGIPVGAYTVEFSDIANWTKPDNQSVTITKDQTTTASGTYIQHTGSLQVTISPQGAIDAGARWRRVGTTTWLASGATESGIPVGAHTVEFSDIANWTKPSNQGVTITKDQTTTEIGRAHV